MREVLFLPDALDVPHNGDYESRQQSLCSYQRFPQRKARTPNPNPTMNGPDANPAQFIYPPPFRRFTFLALNVTTPRA